MTTLSLRLVTTVPRPKDSWDLRALPGGGAIARGGAGPEKLLRFDGRRWSPVAALAKAKAKLFTWCHYRAGDGFGVATPKAVYRFDASGAPLGTFAYEGAWPKRFRSTATPGRGGVSVDADRPVVLGAEGASVVGAFIHPVRLELAAKRARLPLGKKGELVTVRLKDFSVPPFFAANPDLYEHPILTDAAWDGKRQLVFTVGLAENYTKWGMAWSILSSIDAKGAAKHRVEFEEAHEGRFASSMTYLLATPHRKNGPSRGQPSLVALRDDARIAVKLPRGYAGAKIVDHEGEHFWLESANPKVRDKEWAVCGVE